MSAIKSFEVKLLDSTRLAFWLYVAYMVSFFLRIPARLPFLGVIRIDLLLVATIFLLLFFKKTRDKEKNSIVRIILVLIIYSVAALPFSTWPGTVLSKGIPDLIKAVIFFFFTYKLVLNESRLKIIVYVFLFCNTFRVLEPLALHVFTGYWGSRTSFGWDLVDRLSGGPYDVINANGLAFVIASILPFYHYLFGSRGLKYKLVYWCILPLCLYTMSLTLSRSGLLAIAIIYGFIFLKSRRKFLLASIGSIAIIASFSMLNDIQRDRYLSIFSDKTMSSGSAEGRKDGLTRDFFVAMESPILGHGLGTSREANWNFGGNDQPSHNLWLEVMQELGLIGLLIFITYTRAIYKGFNSTKTIASKEGGSSEFMQLCLSAMQVWLIMNILFSFASYGLTSYEWYLFGGFSAVISQIIKQTSNNRLVIAK